MQKEPERRAVARSGTVRHGPQSNPPRLRLLTRGDRGRPSYIFTDAKCAPVILPCLRVNGETIVVKDPDDLTLIDFRLPRE